MLQKVLAVSSKYPGVDSGSAELMSYPYVPGGV